MRVLLKAAGLAALFFCSSALGFYEAEKLKRRVKKLSLFLRAISEYAQRVKVGTEEIDRLLSWCFGKEWITRTEEGFSALSVFTKQEDAELAEEFFHNIGMGNAQQEYERAKMYAALFSERVEEAQTDAQERCRLFRTLGILGGVFLCIILL